jgi:hypothetical protein
LSKELIAEERGFKDNSAMKIIDSIPLSTLVIASLLLGLAPFVPEPHLVQKISMLANNELVKPLDIFDLLMHSSPSVLLVIRLIRIKKKQITAK